MSGNFIGSHYRNLDTKGRLLLPPGFLEALGWKRDNGVSFWMTAFYGRIAAYRTESWNLVADRLCSLNFPSQRLSHFKSKIIGLAQEFFPDSQGRIRISQSLMREAGISWQIVLVGLLDKFEIWDQARFDALPMEDVSEELLACGIQLSL